MRRTSLALLCIALCMTVIIPVSAKKGGGKTPTMVMLTGDILYDTDPPDHDVSYLGPAKYQNTKRSFTLTIGVEGKKQPRNDITFSDKWPDSIFKGKTFESNRTFIVVKGYKYGEWEDGWVSIGHETDTESLVMSCKANWYGDPTSEIRISIYEVTTSNASTYNVQLGFVITIASS